MGDIDGRSPLHIAVRRLAYGATVDNPLEETAQTLPSLRRNSGHDGPAEEELFARSIKTIAILKNVMVAYPGKIDFKDEDNSGFAPVDYALDGDVTDEHLLRCLLRRKHSSKQRRSGKEVLFDVFGIEELLDCGPSDEPPESTQIDQSLNLSDRSKSDKSSGAATPKSKRRSSKLSSSMSSSKRQVNSTEDDGCRSMTDSAIYNRHLEAYLNDFVADVGLECYDDDDDFDIYHDPEEDCAEERLGDSTCIGMPPVIEIDIALDDMDDDNLSQCSYVRSGRSVVSEVTVPAIR